VQRYERWLSNLLPHVTAFKLVVFCDAQSRTILDKYANHNVVLVELPFEDFVTFKFKDHWVSNQKCLPPVLYGNANIEWKLNMLWSEKVFFVNRVVENEYFPETQWYGWCDIGYFRGDEDRAHLPHLHLSQIGEWPSSKTLQRLDKSRVHYAWVGDPTMLHILSKAERHPNGLLVHQIPPEHGMHRQSRLAGMAAGGFFIATKDKAIAWKDTYNHKLTLYFDAGRLVKDDQIIILDCITENVANFSLHREVHPRQNPWFVFQRTLS